MVVWLLRRRPKCPCRRSWPFGQNAGSMVADKQARGKQEQEVEGRAAKDIMPGTSPLFLPAKISQRFGGNFPVERLGARFGGNFARLADVKHQTSPSIHLRYHPHINPKKMFALIGSSTMTMSCGDNVEAGIIPLLIYLLYAFNVGRAIYNPVY